MAEDPPGPGRPSKLTPKLQEQILSLVQSGCYPEVAAGALGVSRSTFYEWMARGEGTDPDRAPTPEYAEFADAIAQAIDKSEVRLVLKTAEYEEGSRKHKRNPDKRVRSRISYPQILQMQWKLSRRFPERWGQRPPQLSVGVSPGSDEGAEAAGVTIAITYAPPITVDDLPLGEPGYGSGGEPNE